MRHLGRIGPVCCVESALSHVSLLSDSIVAPVSMEVEGCHEQTHFLTFLGHVRKHAGPGSEFSVCFYLFGRVGARFLKVSP